MTDVSIAVTEENKQEEWMLTTLDNPFNPFTQFEEWYSFDVGNGYNSCAYLARIAVLSEDLSDEDLALAIDQAMNEIVSLNLSGNYIKVTEKGFVNRAL